MGARSNRGTRCGTHSRTRRGIELVVDRRRQPAAGARLLSAEQPSWSGFPVELHLVSSGYARSILWPADRVVVVAAGSVSVEDRAMARCPRFVAGLGSVTVCPRGHESRSLAWTGPCATLSVELDASTLARLAHRDEHPVRVLLAPRLGIHDAPLAALVHLMAAEVAAGCPTGRAYGESLSLALLEYVSRRHAATAADAPSAGRLPRRLVDRVLEYVRANLASDLSLTELAGVVGLSAYHFSRAFRNAVGVTPHQFVIRERVREARQLLATHRMPIAQVALAVGFSSQSHFTQAFRNVVGTTPRRYQEEH